VFNTSDTLLQGQFTKFQILSSVAIHILDVLRYYHGSECKDYTTFSDVKLHGLVGNANILEKSKYGGSNFL
jgi:hypothetical protein